MDLSKRLIITQPMYFSEPSRDCGYCKGVKQDDSQYYSLDSWETSKGKTGDTHYNCTMGFHCESMSVKMYDKLCNNGFRRSGTFLYKPDLLRSCCRLFTIRTTPDQVTLTKELKSCVKRFKKYVGVSADANTSRKNKPFDYIDIILNTQIRSKRFYTRFEPAIFTKEKYQLFAKYQEKVHNDFKHSESGFKRFLCDAPFDDNVIQGTNEEWESLNSIFTSKETKVKAYRLGPVHECYYFDDKLIAIGVLDFMPSGISSVYFIWDPDYKHWSLGKLSALKELTLLSQMGLPYYYLGYYVDDCPKMNYKAGYGGELLDIVNLKYVPLNYLKTKKIIDGGKLFIMRNFDKNVLSENTINMNVSLDKIGVNEFPTMKDLDNLNNVAEKLYGLHPGSGEFNDLSKIIQELKKLGVCYTLDLQDDILEFVRRYKLDKYRDEIEDKMDEEWESEVGEEEIHNYIDSRLKFPNVVPGLIPLAELLTMIKENKLSELNGRLFLFDLAVHRIRPIFNILEESPEILTMLCNLVRVLGLEMAKKCLVILN
ncbi:arginyltransferase PWA37_005433 [Arxiozyma heterogenica]|uniref:arginyltransferase n=1 Tax=Arxiozyma heterogenica TaxID=278026 RepID=A0AAN7WTG9_9SACH|nr:hypothetical protein RI543_000359 [Kazachstania heterogenica]